MEEDIALFDSKRVTNVPQEFSGMFGVSERFAVLNKLITRDLNKNSSSPTFSLYSKDDITKFLSNPYTYEKQLRQAVTYIYGASPHFRRLIQYFVGLTDLSYVVFPNNIDTATANPKTIGRNYRRVNRTMATMNVRTQFPKILTVCLREDVFFGTLWVTNDSVTIQQLPSDYCAISSIEGNVLNVSFDFSYFDSNSQYLEFYPSEFQKKYNQYLANRTQKWIELDSPYSFAIKANTDILNYALPPFAGILREVYDLEDYKQMKVTKTAIENYAMVVMTLGMNEDGDWAMPLAQAKDFWRNLDAVLPEEIGSILTPMPVEKISFERNHTGDSSTVAEAEQNLFSAAGVSSLLFNNEKASSNALSLSIKADQAITYGIVKSLEDMVNRFLQSQGYGKYFKVTFLDVSPYNRKEAGDAYLKASQVSLPFLTMYAASQGLSPSELEYMNFLENDVLGLYDKFRPLQSSSTMPSSSSTDSKGATDEGGAPKKDIEELSDKREVNQELE